MPFPMLGAAVAGGLGVVGGLLGNRSSAGQAERDRQFQSQEAMASRQFTSAQAKRQMDFQQDMRANQWQVAVEDMRAAGLNPALAYSQGSAGSLGGASGGGASGSGSRATQQDVISPAVASAMQYRRMEEDLKNLKAQRLKTEAETKVVAGNRGQLWGPVVDALLPAIQRFMNDPVSNARGAVNWYTGPMRRAASWYTKPLGAARDKAVDIAGDLRKAIQNQRQQRRR